ncbi:MULTISPECIES: hypothetical protein [unclassified Kitasatospora]|uniref:hypothetical protein n=1 Tax=unclassified Kitasatospora TaxID=2633591 RepID=UPI00070D377A|nr:MULTISPECIES: hypothetical protein [unclassified Kitasatospora]KQV09947.1 hypothetical protein ASC99_11170 [Kitasatospora sp. Root107]KRB63358.1 hypothetical protein ASE03_33275 [Kitasatospora sp. Root187]
MRDIGADLAQAGIVLHGIEPNTSCPPGSASIAAACGPWHGRVDIAVRRDDPDFTRAINAAWLRQATNFRLFAENGQFLLLANLEEDRWEDPDSRWLRVSLGDDWNLAGPAVGGVVGPSRDGLFTMSLDGEVIIEGTTYEEESSVLAVPQPYRAEPFRAWTRHLIDEWKRNGEDTRWAEAWLARASD